MTSPKKIAANITGLLKVRLFLGAGLKLWSLKGLGLNGFAVCIGFGAAGLMGAEAILGGAAIMPAAVCWGLVIGGGGVILTGAGKRSSLDSALAKTKFCSTKEASQPALSKFCLISKSLCPRFWASWI